MVKEEISKLSHNGSEHEASKPKIYISSTIKLNIKNLENSFYRADIEFVGVEHSGPSYEGRVFINNRGANEDTSLSLDRGYVGSYYIFGHGGCIGDVGHCEVKERSAFDFRPPHPLTPIDLHVTVTDQIKELGKNTDEFVISIVPILAGGSKLEDDELVRLDSISIYTYNS